MPIRWNPLWEDSLDSTNTRLAQWIRERRVLPGAVLAAREQTAGRGRYDRRWLARPGCNLTFSLYLSTTRGFPAIASIPAAAALGVSDYLRDAHGIDGRVKWPNDVMVSGRKICGILSERVSLPSTPASAATPAAEAIVVGIGVNLNMSAEDAAQVDKPATSVLMEAGVSCAPEEELLRLLQPLGHWLTRWEEAGFSALRAELLRRAWKIGETVMVGDGDQKISGTFEGFGESGELLLRLSDGELRPCWAGDFAY